MPYKPRRHLQSGAKGLLDEPQTRLKFGDQEIRSNFFFMINTYLRTLEAISRACSGYTKGGSVLEVLS